jgi:uncharacterized protein with HEPN domain
MQQPEIPSALLDIHDAASNTARLANITMHALEVDDVLAAIMYYLIVLGEAVKRLPVEFRSEHPSVRWSQIAGLRDALVHRYDRIGSGQVRRIALEDVPRLLEYIEPLLPQQS